MASDFSIIIPASFPSVEILRTEVSKHSFPLHYHKRHCIGQIISGEMVLRLNGMELRYKKGDHYAIPAFKVHTCKPSGNQPVFCSVICFRNSDELKELECFSGFSDMLKKLDVLTLFRYASEFQIVKTRYTGLIETLIACISENFDCPIAIKTLANHVQLSISRLQHIFKDSVGISLKSFIIQEKLRQSRYILSEKSMADITYKCGFYDQSHFIHQFKKYNGLSPSQYKSAVRFINI